MKKIEITAKTVNEAIEKALAELNTTKDKVKIDIIDEGTKGFLSMFGSKPAKIVVSLLEENTDVNNILDSKVNSNNESIKETKEIKKEVSEDVDVDYITRAKAFLREVLDSMEIMAEIKIKEENDVLYIKLTGPKMGLIIGYRGETLDALQYLVSLVVNKGNNLTYKKVVLDTENYREKREQTLKRLAIKTAGKVKKMGRPYKLEPMNPYERRIIHSALQNETGIITYSEGEEPYRRIVVDVKR